LPLLSQPVLYRHLAVLEDELRGVGTPHAELVELRTVGEALHAPLHEE
jgi:hypothetical protein